MALPAHDVRPTGNPKMPAEIQGGPGTRVIEQRVATSPPRTPHWCSLRTQSTEPDTGEERIRAVEHPAVAQAREVQATPGASPQSLTSYGPGVEMQLPVNSPVTTDAIRPRVSRSVSHLIDPAKDWTTGSISRQVASVASLVCRWPRTCKVDYEQVGS